MTDPIPSISDAVKAKVAATQSAIQTDVTQVETAAKSSWLTWRVPVLCLIGGLILGYIISKL